MVRLFFSVFILVAFFSGCCGRKCVTNDHQAEKSKIEAQKAFDELDKEKKKDNSQ